MITTDELRERLDSIDDHTRELSAKGLVDRLPVTVRYRDALRDAIAALEARDREIAELQHTLESHDENGHNVTNGQFVAMRERAEEEEAELTQLRAERDQWKANAKEWEKLALRYRDESVQLRAERDQWKRRAETAEQRASDMGEQLSERWIEREDLRTERERLQTALDHASYDLDPEDKAIIWQILHPEQVEAALTQREGVETDE